jgi:uncharacterized phage protein gp47/JayE
MSGSVTFPLATLSAVVTPTGISAPTLAQIVLSLQASYASIYGTDIVWDPALQDTQWVGIIAQAVFDANQTAIAVYNQFSPATAVGVGLSSVVKINGIQRETPTNSTADVILGGAPGTIINLGTVGDDLNLGTTWSLPPSVTIEPSGTLATTVTCVQPGSVAADANTLINILSPVGIGWQTVTNSSNASPGVPLESDAVLRNRQTQSTALPALTPLDSVVGNLLNLGGVTGVGGYVNNTGTTDMNGVPAYSWALVVNGGTLQDVVNVIGQGKTPGPPTFGGVSGAYVSPYGIPETIQFSVPAEETIIIAITLKPLAGFSSAIAVEIQNSVAAFINSLNLIPGSMTGNGVLISRLYVPAQLAWSGYGPAQSSNPAYQQLMSLTPLAASYEIMTIAAAISPGTPTATDVPIAWNQIADTSASDVNITVS